jgi:hypothetical protein
MLLKFEQSQILQMLTQGTNETHEQARTLDTKIIRAWRRF